MIKCALCGRNFNPGDLVILEDQDKKTTFHVICGKCGTSSLVFLSASHEGMVGLGIATDLNQKEAMKMFGQDVISADEVIDAYQMMSEHKGSLADLVKEIDE